VTPAVLFLAVLPSTAAAPPTGAVTASQPPGCAKTYTQAHVRAAARKVWRHTSPVTGRERRAVRRYIRCARRPASRPAMRRTVRRWKAWRVAHRWQIEWERFAPADRIWATRVAYCESTNNPRAHSPGGHHGLMQFLLSTARAAGFSGDPHLASRHEQLVRAVWWSHRAGRSQWECR
jgi:soluble lytic murein transglycosylase-like protein